LFVFAARDALGVFRSAVFAAVAGRAVVIRGAGVRFASVRCRNGSRRTRIIARIVAGAGDTFAGVCAVERITLAAIFGRFAIATAVAVGDGVAGASAFVFARVVFRTAFARTVAVQVLTRRTA